MAGWTRNEMVERSRVLEEGRVAREQGKSYATNPYDRQDINYVRWNSGYEDESRKRAPDVFMMVMADGIPDSAMRVPFPVIEAMEMAIIMNEDRGPQWQAKYAFSAMAQAFEMLRCGQDPRDMPMLQRE